MRPARSASALSSMRRRGSSVSTTVASRRRRRTLTISSSARVGLRGRCEELLPGAVERRDVGGWFRPDERLYVGGRDRTKLIDGVLWQAEQVRAALGDMPVPIYAYLCFTRTSWRRFVTRPLTVRRVGIASPSKVAEFAAAGGALRADEMQAIAVQLGGAFKPA